MHVIGRKCKRNMDYRVGLVLHWFNEFTKVPFPLFSLLSYVRVNIRQVSLCEPKMSDIPPYATSFLICSGEDSKSTIRKVFQKMEETSFPKAPSKCLLPFIALS